MAKKKDPPGCCERIGAHGVAPALKELFDAWDKSSVDSGAIMSILLRDDPSLSVIAREMI